MEEGHPTPNTPSLASWAFLALGPWEGSVLKEQSSLSPGEGGRFHPREVICQEQSYKRSELLADHKPWAWPLPPFVSHRLQHGS